MLDLSEQRVEGRRLVDPLHLERERLALRRLEAETRSRRERSFLSANDLSTIAPYGPRSSIDASEPVCPLEVVDLGDRLRIEAGDLPVPSPRPCRPRRERSRRPRPPAPWRSRRRRSARSSRTRSADDEHVRRLHLPLDRSAVRLLHAVGKHRDEGHEREPDHERCSRRSGAARVPAGVLAREPIRGRDRSGRPAGRSQTRARGAAGSPSSTTQTTSTTSVTRHCDDEAPADRAAQVAHRPRRREQHARPDHQEHEQARRRAAPIRRSTEIPRA